MYFETSNIIWNLINFLALIVFLYLVAAKPIANMIKGKQDKVTSSLTSVEERLTEITKKIEGQAEHLEVIKKEIKQIEEQAQSMSQKLYEEVIASANYEAEKIREQMKRSMEQDISRSRRDLRLEVVDKALAKAQQLAKQKLDNNLQIKIIESFALSLDNSKSSKN